MMPISNLTNIIYLETIDSTNNYANKIIKEKHIKEGTVIWAKEQTHGKGHGKNYWESDAGENLTFSIIYHPDFLNINDHFYISKFISLGLTDFLENEIDSVSIKWPNDIYVENKKIAGILIENIILKDKITTSVIGIGLNVNQKSFYSDAPNPVSLTQITQKEYNLEKVLENLLVCLNKQYAKLKFGDKKDIFVQYLEKLYRFNSYSQYKAGNTYFNGKIIGISAIGELIIEKSDGEIRAFNF